MEEDTRTGINRIIMELSKEEGEVIPIAQIVERAADEGISEDDVRAEIKALIEEGMLTKLDESSVQLDM